jgi:spermidine/putrescine ABC transporter ATP-binding subunit
VSKWYGADAPAVDDIDLCIGTGEFFSLLGPSGCGKSTTLRMIAGFEHPDEGDIRLQGESVVGRPPSRLDVNMVFQSYALFPHLSVFDNVAYGLRRKHVPRAEVTKRVGDMLDLMELGPLAKRRSRGLSGGQQQRVALARALVNRPAALLLDEPLGALDLKLRQAMQAELKRIQRDVGITFVYVTHDQSEALVMSDRIAVMDQGRVQQLGTPEEVYETPRNRFVAGFIGTSNILAGTVRSVVDGIGVIELGVDDRILVPERDGLVCPGRSTYLTVRPEKIDLVVGAALDRTDCRLRGRVAEIAYLGTSTSYSVNTLTGATIVVHRQNAAGSVIGPRVGDDVSLCWEAENSFALAE